MLSTCLWCQILCEFLSLSYCVLFLQCSNVFIPSMSTFCFFFMCQCFPSAVNLAPHATCSVSAFFYCCYVFLFHNSSLCVCVALPYCIFFISVFVTLSCCIFFIYVCMLLCHIVYFSSLCVLLCHIVSFSCSCEFSIVYMHVA